MTLKEFLKNNGETIETFAKRLRLSYAAVRQYANAGRVPKPAVMRKIIAATDGAVQPNDFFADDAEGVDE